MLKYIQVIIMKHVEVVAAVIVDESDRIFCAQRGNHGPLGLKWEFPGGKIEQGETHQEALVREITEELDTDIKVLNHIFTVNHQYETFRITMHAYYSKVLKGNLTLNEHVDSVWLSRNDLNQLDWAEADIPIVDILRGK